MSPPSAVPPIRSICGGSGSRIVSACDVQVCFLLSKPLLPRVVGVVPRGCCGAGETVLCRRVVVLD